MAHEPSDPSPRRRIPQQITWLRSVLPPPLAADGRERLRVVLGAALGILLTAWLCRLAAASGAGAWPWLVAPMGASAVLVFATPASPLAQPWAVVGGNTVSALVGLACARWLGPGEATAALAVGGAIAAMFALRCLHPPGGASALLMVLTGVHEPAFALFPVMTNSLVLVAAGIAWHRATRRTVLPPPHARDHDADAVDADLDAVLARYNRVLDIGRDDLKALLQDTQLRGYQRQLADLRCRDIMSRRLVTVRHSTLLTQAAGLLRDHRIKALPVVDRTGGIVGIVTPADLVRGQASDARTVGEVMTRQVRVAGVDRHLAELIPLFGSSGHHHIPIVEPDGQLVGIVTQSDVVAALARPTVRS